MLDREDIDALLIGRLYGELSSADEARLQAYLAGPSEQAKADKRALEDMTSARSAVRESRLLAEQVDPPQSISALLMQEAARRAPKQKDESEGWFARFVRSFMAHPAMAAAATLVLVVAVGGTLYMRNGKQLAEDRIAAAPTEPAPRLDDAKDRVYAPAPATAMAPTEGRGGMDTGAVAQQANGQGIVVGLEDDALKGRAEPPKPASRGIVVSTPEPQPKELEESQRAERTVVARDRKQDAQEKLGMVSDDEADTDAADSYQAGGAAAPASEAADKQKVTSKKPAPSTMAPQAPPPPPAPPPPADGAKVTSEQKQHRAIVAAAKDQRCDNAAALAVRLEDSNPSYYDAEVANDRDLKACMQQINRQREQVAAKRARAKKQRIEPVKPTPSQTTSESK